MPPSPAGRDAPSPWSMPWPAWKEIALRSWREAGQDNIGLVSAGVAFYGFLALVPLLGAIVLSYGLIAEPATVIRNMQALTSVMPADAAKLVGEQLMNVVKTSDGKKGFGVLLALALALFGARNAAGAVITALNIAYEEEEKRGFLRLNLLTLAMTAAAVVVALVATVAVAALGHLEDLLGDLPGVFAIAGKLVSYLLLLLVGAAGAATLYRYGPSRRQARWIWITPGSMLAALLWLVLTVGFGIYVANFGNYNATYGSLGAVVVLLTWLYLSAYVLLLSAELNSEIEHQTATDTTRGAPRAPGARGAWAADHIATEPEPAQGQTPPPLAKEPDQPGVAGHYAAARRDARAAQLAGLGKVGMLTSALAAIGLARLRAGARPAQGAALLAAAGAVAWLKRDKSARTGGQR